MTAFLDDELLADFERALTSAGSAITRVWAPGLSDAKIDQLTAPHKFSLPEEARRWWRWHNGFVAGTRPPFWELTPRRTLMDLPTTLESFATSRAALLQLEGVDQWLRPLADLPRIFFACDGPLDEPVSIHTQQDIDDPILALPSIGELVKTWIELVDIGVFTADADGRWESDFDKIPEEIRQLGIY